MKQILCLIIGVAFLFSCSKNNEKDQEQFDTNALIIGPDYSLCPCCGGHIIELYDDNEVYRFEALPEESDIDLTKDSIKVKLNWTLNRACGTFKYINIEKIVSN